MPCLHAPEGSSASRQRLRQRCATVDHSDIRGSSASTRHHGRDPSGAAFRLEARVRPAGLPHRCVEDSPLPRATPAAVCLRFALHPSDPIEPSGGLAQRDNCLAFHVYADRPDEAEELSPHSCDYLLLAFAPCHEPHVALMQPLLRLPEFVSSGARRPWRSRNLLKRWRARS